MMHEKMASFSVLQFLMGLVKFGTRGMLSWGSISELVKALVLWWVVCCISSVLLKAKLSSWCVTEQQFTS